MNRVSWACVIAVGLVPFAASCYEEDGAPSGPAEFGRPIDVDMAEEMARAMIANDYTSPSGTTWSFFPGKEGIHPNRAPHGPKARYYVNDLARANIEQLGDGAIIVKQNLKPCDMPKPECNIMDANAMLFIDSITVMKKVFGYNPDYGDFLFAKYDAKLELLVVPPMAPNNANRKMAGRIGQGTSGGCIGCHSKAPGDDYLFITPTVAWPY